MVIPEMEDVYLGSEASLNCTST